MGATAKSKRRRWKVINNQTKDCPHCGPHKGENARKRPKPDKYKSERKGK